MKYLYAFALTFVSQLAAASIIQIDYTGTLNRATDLHGNVLNGHVNGDTVGGSFRIDLSKMPADSSASPNSLNAYINTGNDSSFVTATYNDFNIIEPVPSAATPKLLDQVALSNQSGVIAKDHFIMKSISNTDGNGIFCGASLGVTYFDCSLNIFDISLNASTFNGDSFPQSFTTADLLPNSKVQFKYVSVTPNNVASAQGYIDLTTVSYSVINTQTGGGNQNGGSTSVSEPSSIALLGLGLAGLLAHRRKQA